MALTIEEVEHIAKLARLELSADQKVLYRQQLSRILEHIAALGRLDTASVPATAGGGMPRMVLRADHTEDGLSSDALLKNAPDSQDAQFKIPPVFD